jgi:hypothetical protein
MLLLSSCRVGKIHLQLFARTPQHIDQHSPQWVSSSIRNKKKTNHSVSVNHIVVCVYVNLGNSAGWPLWVIRAACANYSMLSSKDKIDIRPWKFFYNLYQARASHFSHTEPSQSQVAASPSHLGCQSLLKQDFYKEGLVPLPHWLTCFCVSSWSLALTRWTLLTSRLAFTNPEMH